MTITQELIDAERVKFEAVLDNRPETLNGEQLKPTYEQLEALYNAQCECTDEWAEKYEQAQAENLNLVKDAERYRWLKNNYHGFEMFRKSPIPYVTLDSEVDKAITTKKG